MQAAILPGFAARSDDLDDPATQLHLQSLRVLLGQGQAQTLDAQTFVFEGRRFRGTFSNSAAGVVSTVPLEQYLYSVVPREMPRAWPSAALQAQAIVARTYVLARSNPQRDYDLIPSQANQVYTGMDAEHPESSAAVDATSGTILRFAGGFANSAYSSCCGGHTENSADAWGGPPLKYLSGVRCTFCVDSPWFAWSQTIPEQKLRAALRPRLASIGDLRDVTLDPADASGRAHTWTFEGENGWVRIKAAQVRQAAGTRTIPSLLIHRMQFDCPDPTPASLTVQGSGLGHGVGLCQWGARGMAIAGHDARAILLFYYPGTQVGNV